MQRVSGVVRVARPAVLATAARAASASVTRLASAHVAASLPVMQTRGYEGGNDAGAQSRFIPKPVFSSYKIYKTKTALDIAVVRAQLGWNAGPDRKYLSLKRAGGFRLTFAAGENRSYEWDQAEIITLNITELGDLLSFAESKDLPELKFFHDPGLGSDVAGQVRKELVVKRIGGGKPGYFFNFGVTAKGGDSASAGQRKWSLAVSEGEFQVFLTLIRQTMPDLLALSTKPIVQRDDAQEGEQQQQQPAPPQNNYSNNDRQSSSSGNYQKKWQK